jgi:hypothetical protein
MREIPLTQGKVAIVDDVDFESLNERKWFAARRPNTFYAMRNGSRQGGGRRGPPELMHRVILARKLGRVLDPREKPDHWNGDGLDNQRDNLRLATHAQNCRNCRRHANNLVSQYLGVVWHKCTKKWCTRIMVNHRQVYLGLYPTEIAAAQAREVYIVAHPELMARPNFPHQPLTPNP